MVPAHSHKVPRVSWYSGSRHVDSSFGYGSFTLFGWLSQNHSPKLIESILRSEPQHARTLVWALPVSLAATPGIDVSFSSSGYLDVSVHRVPLHTLWIGVWILEVCSSGFPHSEISGSKGICPSPKLIAAYHVFHRLLVPRHPPCALLRLTTAYIALYASVGFVFKSFLSCLLLSYNLKFPSSYPRMSCDESSSVRIRELANRFARSEYSLHDSSDIYFLYAVFKVHIYLAVLSAI